MSLAGVFKELLLANAFGPRDDLDALMIGLMLPLFALAVIGRSLIAAVIPSYVEVLQNEGEDEAAALFMSVVRRAVPLLLLATLLLAVLGYLTLPLLASKFSETKLTLARHLFLLLSPLLLLGGVSSLLSGLLNSRKILGPVTIVGIISPMLVALLFILAGHQVTIVLVAAATLLGGVMEAAILLLMARKHIHWSAERHHKAREVLSQWIPLMAGSLLMASTLMVDQIMAARLQSGSVSLLALGNKVVAFSLAIGATAIGTAFLPHFSSLVSQARWSEIVTILRRYSFLIMALSIPLVMAAIVWATPLLSLIFERGELNANDALALSKLHSMFALQIPFYLIGMMLVRLASAMQLNYIIARVAGINLVANIVLNLILMRLMGVSGIALSTSIVYLLSTCLLIFSIWGHLSLKVRQAGLAH